MFNIDIIDAYFVRNDNDGYQSAVSFVDVIVLVDRKAPGIREVDNALLTVAALGRNRQLVGKRS